MKSLFLLYVTTVTNKRYSPRHMSKGHLSRDGDGGMYKHKKTNNTHSSDTLTVHIRRVPAIHRCEVVFTSRIYLQYMNN